MSASTKFSFHRSFVRYRPPRARLPRAAPLRCTPIETTRRPPSRFSHTNEATFGARCRPNASLVGGHVTIRPPCSSPRQTCVALFGYDPKRADATHFCHISWVVAGLLVTCAARHQLRAAAPRWGCLGANGTREAVLELRWTRLGTATRMYQSTFGGRGVAGRAPRPARDDLGVEEHLRAADGRAASE